jgi:hypothetical protein
LGEYFARFIERDVPNSPGAWYAPRVDSRSTKEPTHANRVAKQGGAGQTARHAKPHLFLFCLVLDLIRFVLAGALDDALALEVRRSGGASGLRVDLGALEWTDAVLVRFRTTPKADATPRIIDALDRLAAGEIAEDALLRARALSRARLAALDDDPAALARLLTPLPGAAVLLPTAADVDAVDLAALKRAAAETLGRERMLLASFGRAFPNASRQTEVRR